MQVRIRIEKSHVVGVALVLLLTGAFLIWQRHHSTSITSKNQVASSTGLSPSAGTITADSPEVKTLQEIGAKQGAQAAYEYLKDHYGSDQVRAHDLAHVVGQLAYQKMGAKGFAVCDANFAFGCYHGLLQALIKDQGPEGISIAETACNQLSPVGAVYSCLHGLGHGVMSEAGKIDAAIAKCQTLAQNEQIYCFDGSYMEYYTGVMSGDATKTSEVYDTANPWNFCLSQPGVAQTQCVRNHVPFLFSKISDTKTATGECLKLTGDNKSFCIQSVGLYATQHQAVLQYAPKTLCANFSASDAAECISFAAKEIVFENQPMANATGLCASLPSTAFKTQCLAAVKETSNEYRRQ